jgi:hypothetical protein
MSMKSLNIEGRDDRSDSQGSADTRSKSSRAPSFSMFTTGSGAEFNHNNNNEEDVRKQRLSELQNSLSKSQFVLGAVKSDYHFRQDSHARSTMPKILSVLEEIRYDEPDTTTAAAATTTTNKDPVAATISQDKSKNRLSLLREFMNKSQKSSGNLKISKGT